MNYHTYIILCRNGKYYVGHTINLRLRFARHEGRSGAKFTAQNSPIKVVWEQAFETELASIRREKQIKGWSRIKKEKLIHGIWK